MSNPQHATQTSDYRAAICLILALLIAALMSQTIDGSLALWAQSHDSALWHKITGFGKSEWVLVPTLLLYLLALIAARLATSPRRKRALSQISGIALFLFAIVAIPGIVVALLKQLIGRARPEHLADLGSHHFAIFSGSGFASMPSGHTVTSFVFAWGIAFLWPVWRWPAFAVASIIALSRPIVGAHYVSDVIVGIAFAGLSAYAIRAWMAKRRKIFQQRDGTIIRRSLTSAARLFS